MVTLQQEHYDNSVCVVCGIQDGCSCGAEPCPDCDGGTIVTCPDDLCHTGSGCIHGDGEVYCNTCEGEGEVYPRRVTWEEYEKMKDVGNFFPTENIIADKQNPQNNDNKKNVAD